MGQEAFMSAIEKRIGSRITEIRLSKKLTQAQLAEKVNLSVETISRLERAISFPSLKTLEYIAKALGVPLKSFFDFADSEPKNEVYERDLAKLTAFLRTLSTKDIRLIHEILKVVFSKIKTN